MKVWTVRCSIFLEFIWGFLHLIHLSLFLSFFIVFYFFFLRPHFDVGFLQMRNRVIFLFHQISIRKMHFESLLHDHFLLRWFFILFHFELVCKKFWMLHHYVLKIKPTYIWKKSSTITKPYRFPLKLVVLSGPNRFMWRSSKGLWVETKSFILKLLLTCVPLVHASHILSLSKLIFGSPLTRSSLKIFEIVFILTCSTLLC